MRANVTSLPVCVNPAGGFNCYWEMPFRKHARITVENLSPDDVRGFYYQVTYTLTEVPADRAYFHAQWRRSNPLPYMQDHTLLDGVQGQGQYVGTYIAWGVNNNGWWGEGEIKFFMDGDTDWPTICGTGTEDYFCGAWDFEQPEGPVLRLLHALHRPAAGDHGRRPVSRCSSASGCTAGTSWTRSASQQDLRVTIQALGWRSQLEGKSRYLPLQDDIASTAFWYQTEPHAPFPALPDMNGLEVI